MYKVKITCVEDIQPGDHVTVVWGGDNDATLSGIVRTVDSAPRLRRLGVADRMLWLSDNPDWYPHAWRVTDAARDVPESETDINERESRTEMNTIEITRIEDVRDGDRVTLTRDGTVLTGEVFRVRHGSARTYFEMTGMGDMSVARAGGAWVFHGATREVPDLPTKEGSVIVNATIRGETGHTAILDDDGSWFTPRPVGGVFYLHSPESITYWEPARIVREEEQA